MRLRVLASVFVSLALIACVRQSADCTTETPNTSDAASDDPLVALYVLGLEIARHPTPQRAVDSLLVLEPGNPALRFDAAGRVLVTTWTRTQFYSTPEYAKGYEFALYGETWFTSGNQVQDACRASGKTGEDLDLRLQQLLGIPPGATYDAFLQVWIDPAALFRPCADPSVTASTCPVSAPLSSKAADHVAWDCSNPADAHAQWLCNSWAIRYGNSNPLQQYPWTALGYTYDWSPESEAGVGPSEFVANAKTNVVFEQLVPTADFCKAP